MGEDLHLCGAAEPSSLETLLKQLLGLRGGAFFCHFGVLGGCLVNTGEQEEKLLSIAEGSEGGGRIVLGCFWPRRAFSIRLQHVAKTKKTRV